MKKTYIEPKNTVVSINLETLIANSPTPPVNSGAASEEYNAGDGSNSLGREVIKSQDVWEEW